MRKFTVLRYLITILIAFISYQTAYADSNQIYPTFILSKPIVKIDSLYVRQRPAKRSSQVSTAVSDTKLNNSDTTHINYFKLAIDKVLSVNASVDFQTKDGTAIAGKDYLAVTGTAIIPAGETSVDIAITIFTDNLSEKSENFFLVISNPIGAKFPTGVTEITVEHQIVDDLVTGQFIDDPVQGLGYSCSSGLTGTTNSNGEYTCQQGDTVTFSLGGRTLGSVTAQTTVITPYSLFPTNTKAGLNVARLLQSIDADNNSSNGIIVIDSNFTLPSQTDFSSAGFETTLESALSIQLVNAVDAQTQLHSGIASAGGTIPTGVTVLTDNTNTGSGTSSGGSSGGGTSVVSDTTAPSTPTLTSTPNSTKNSSVSVEVNGEANATVWVNSSQAGSLASNGKATISLDSSGDDGSKSFAITLKDSSGNSSNALTISITKDTTAPTTPTLTTTPTTTQTETTNVEVNGEANASVFVDDAQVGTISSAGTLTVSLDTRGNNGELSFAIKLKDSLENESDTLTLTITKQSDAPTIDSVQTADTSPALSGTLPTGESYSLTVKINDSSYNVTNNDNGTWSLAQGTISTLSEGFYDVELTVSDGSSNSTTTTLVNKIEINNTGFLIDSAVEGIKYVSGSLTGYTDSDGLFKYAQGQTVTFYIGDESTGITLGNSATKTDPNNDQRKIITLFDIAGSQDENDNKVLNMGKLLQSLDSDKDVSNGITIDERTKESIALLGMKTKVDFTQEADTFADNEDIYNLLNDLADHFGEHRGLLSSEDTQAHLVAIRDNTLATQQNTTSVVRGEKEEIKILTGVLKTTAGVIEGVKFRSGNQSGLTDASGVFSYEEGKQVTFSIYQLELGITQGKANISPADLVISTSFDHPKPRNIIRLLNAFDAMADDGKVTIDSAIREALEIYRSQIDLNLPDGKANTELGIAKGEDEFGAQFEEFELGKEILDKITALRTGS
jgi:uncharacterized protein YjgD (DUF1641 family)